VRHFRREKSTIDLPDEGSFRERPSSVPASREHLLPRGEKELARPSLGRSKSHWPPASNCTARPRRKGRATGTEKKGQLLKKRGELAMNRDLSFPNKHRGGSYQSTTGTRRRLQGWRSANARRQLPPIPIGPKNRPVLHGMRAGFCSCPCKVLGFNRTKMFHVNHFWNSSTLEKTHRLVGSRGAFV
jgi:hypothetical protein